MITSINPELEFYGRLNELVLEAARAGVAWTTIIDDLRTLAAVLDREENLK